MRFCKRLMAQPFSSARPQRAAYESVWSGGPIPNVNESALRILFSHAARDLGYCAAGSAWQRVYVCNLFPAWTELCHVSVNTWRFLLVPHFLIPERRQAAILRHAQANYLGTQHRLHNFFKKLGVARQVCYGWHIILSSSGEPHNLTR